MNRIIDILKITPYELLETCNTNKDEIKAYLNGETLEYDGDGTMVGGMSIGFFISWVVITIVIQVIIYTYIKNRKNMLDESLYTVCMVLWFLSWFAGGMLSIIALIIVMVSTTTSTSSSKSVKK